MTDLALADLRRLFHGGTFSTLEAMMGVKAWGQYAPKLWEQLDLAVWEALSFRPADYHTAEHVRGLVGVLEQARSGRAFEADIRRAWADRARDKIAEVEGRHR